MLVHMHEYTEELQRFESRLRAGEAKDPSVAQSVPMKNVAVVGLMLPNYIPSTEVDDWELMLKNEDQLYDNMMSYVIAPLSARAVPRKSRGAGMWEAPSSASLIGLGVATIAVAAGVAILVHQRAALEWARSLTRVARSD